MMMKCPKCGKYSNAGHNYPRIKKYFLKVFMTCWQLVILRKASENLNIKKEEKVKAKSKEKADSSISLHVSFSFSNLI